MKIGILDCDTLRETLQPQYGRHYSTMFMEAFRALDPSLEFATWSAIEGQLPVDAHVCDAWLITGSKHDAFSAVPWVEALRVWIRRVAAEQHKLVGVCFGHQVIAAALGGAVARSEKGWGVGHAAYPVLQRKDWMPEELNSLDVLVVHRDQVHSLPAGSELLAGNDFCPHYSYQIGEHILCIQGHPEFSKVYNRAILDILRQELGEQRYAVAVQSLQKDINSALLLQGMLNFMQAPSLSAV